MKLNEGLPITTIAVHPDGSYKIYESMTDASKDNGVSLQYVSRSAKKNTLRPYQSLTPNKRPIRFTTDMSSAMILAGRNKIDYEKFESRM